MGSVVTDFSWSGNRLVGETTNNVTRSYIYTPNSYAPVAFMENDALYQVHSDHLQTPMAVTDAQGDVVWSLDQSAFGIRDSVELIMNGVIKGLMDND